ncbi:glycosyltransferase family 4 protein [Iningainema tapete]|uniref:Glycosyltransferase family 4 protein n=1 Tax=Iningainema tapete BLCC-T55 TaxID=2748662 RepID=A0A8J6XLE5_9CYAN|nr:glycosyltransferase family 4 protein [Iningainema tapete]MBD2778479.1 glycosyltransferase family 4 protein [Iningainema tapete BLCC-T55]
MHIIVLEVEPTSLRGGQEVVLFDICYGLAQRGHTISLVYTKEGNLLEKYQQFCQHTVKADQLTIYPPQKNLRFLADIWHINKQISITQKSIVFSNQYQDTYFGRLLAITKRIPLLCYLHLPPAEKFIEMKGVKQYLRDTYIKWQRKIGLQGVKHFIAVSHQTKQDWINEGYQDDVIDVVHNGINLQVYKPTTDFVLTRKEWNLPPDIKVISYVGRLDKEKGVETLIKAFAILQKSHANTKLLIAGKSLFQGDKYRQTLEQLGTELGIKDNVTFLGHVTNTTSLYQVSDVTVLPSLWSEPFPRSVLESMACGTPVVASRIGGIPESLTGEFQNGLCESGNEQDLSDTLNRIITWRDKDPLLGDRCREHIVSKFSLDKMVAHVEKVLERLMLGD